MTGRGDSNAFLEYLAAAMVRSTKLIIVQQELWPVSKTARRRSAARRVKAAKPTSTGRFDAVMKAAANSGLLKDKSSRIGGRISPALLRQAKERTGIETDTDLIEFALANIALEENFANAFMQSRGKVDRNLKLGF
jgi:hypothetical protein